MDFDNARRILGIPGAPWASCPGRDTGRRQGLGLCSLSVSAGAHRGAAKRHPRAGAGWRYFPRLRLARGALRCWAFGYFGRRAGALEEMRPQKSAAKSAGLHLYQVLNKFAYGWMPHNAGFGFLDLTPSILLLRQFWG